MGTLFFCKKSTWKDLRSNLPAVRLPPARRTALPQANSSRQPLFVSQFPRCISFSHSENPLKWEECLISRIDPELSRSPAVRCGAVWQCVRCRNAIWEEQWQTRLISHDWCRRLLKVVPAALIPLITHLFADQQMSSHGGLFTSDSERVEFDVIFAGYCKRCSLKRVHIGFGLCLVDYRLLEYVP